MTLMMKLNLFAMTQRTSDPLPLPILLFLTLLLLHYYLQVTPDTLTMQHSFSNRMLKFVQQHYLTAATLRHHI